MTPKKRQPPREPPDIQDILRLHMEATERCEALLREAQRLRKAGKTAKAKKVQLEAEKLGRQIIEMEETVKRKDTDSTSEKP